jgi:type IV pilus assembly protein PilY1
LKADFDYRYLFTWFDTDNDGIVDDGADVSIDDSGEVFKFVEDNIPANATGIMNATVINWVRGYDGNEVLRSRTYEEGGTEKVWRLGDVIHSTPTVVAAPAENYDLYWGDFSYTAFYRKYRNRRIMVYFGGNDGILHAVNGGFYNQEEQKFYTAYDSSSDPDYSDNIGDPDLGAEMWGYVPYNLLPHLSCLTNPKYEHQYYVDLHPRAFEVRAWTDKWNNPSCDHPNGWGTILVCGMRFGGPHIGIGGRDFASSYFIFDVTDPEQDPELLGEVTFDYDDPNKAELGYSLSVPTVVPTFNSIGQQRWYLALGSGPEAENVNLTDAESTKNATLAFIPLHKLTDTSSDFSLKIPASTPGENSAGILTTSYSNSYIGSDLVTLDYDFDTQSDMLYFGTVSGPDSSGDYNGSLSRVQVGNATSIGSWSVHKLLDAKRPVMSTPNLGWHNDRIWLYFGTGRYLTSDDASDTTQQYFFGIKEPMDNSTGEYTFDSVSIDYSNPDKSDWIVSSDINVVDSGAIECEGGGSGCFTDYDANGLVAYDFDHLEDYAISIADYGWYRELNATERVVGQPSLLGGLLNFTAYSPNDDVCQSEGESLLYSLYYLTGTAWTENVFGEPDEDGNVSYTKELGRGLAITPTMHLGSEEGGKVVVQTSTGAIQEVQQPNMPIKNVHSGPSSWHTHDVGE